jgi:hypothetical protein
MPLAATCSRVPNLLRERCHRSTDWDIWSSVSVCGPHDKNYCRFFIPIRHVAQPSFSEDCYEFARGLERKMKLSNALIRLAAAGGAALSISAASAMPIGLALGIASNDEQVRYV